MITATFKMEKVTKNTIRFTEVLANELDAPKIGTIYVPKSTLAELRYQDGDSIELSLKLGK